MASSALCRGSMPGLRPTSRPTALLNTSFSALSLTSVSQTSSFHSSGALSMPPPAKKAPGRAPVKRDTFRVKTSAKYNRVKPTRPKPPAVGERKAIRKRIVLSNTNAFEVPGLAELAPENMAEKSLHGKMLALPDSVIDQLRAAEAFKTSQSWKLFRRPAVLVREETLALGRMFEAVEQEKGSTSRKLVTGSKGTGKSLLLVQAMAMAFVKGWIVIPMTECQELTTGTTTYTPANETKPLQYIQKKATAALLERIATANKEVLSQLTLAHAHPDINTPVQENMSLDRFALLGARTPDLAWPVFNGLWKELTSTIPDDARKADFKPRPPIAMVADNLAHWMHETAYLNPELSKIHAHDFLLVKHFLDAMANPKAAFPNGGAMLYATSKSNAPSVPTFNLTVDQLRARNKGIAPSDPEYPLPEAYQPIDARVSSFFDAVKPGEIDVVDLKGLSRAEAKGLMEYFARSGVVKDRITEEWVGEKWTLAGGGIVGELQRLGTRIRA